MPRLNEQTIALPQPLARAVAQAQESWQSRDNTRRLWNADAALWTGRDEGDWLGWLDPLEDAKRDAEALQEFARWVHAERFSGALLMGMGGSSLGPEVLTQSLGAAPGFPRLCVLDSTDPERVRRFERGLDLARTLFIASSKSGTTLEPNVLMDYFLAKTADAIGSARAAEHFVAITDTGSPLEKLARARGFRRVFTGRRNIGGRYSVLSTFGLVPLAASGHDPQAFVEAAQVMAEACGPTAPAAENPGVVLGLTIGVSAAHGRDKLTMIASPSVAAFGAWAEQLLAESTGKNGQGIIPIADEPLGDSAAYGSDRMFVYLRAGARADLRQDSAVDVLERAGHPVVRINVASPMQLAQEFFRFEIATAVAGALLRINPFDQPDVEASKVATRAMTEAFERTGVLPAETPVCEEGGIALYIDARNVQALRQLGAGASLASWLKAHFARIGAGDYFALLAYVDAQERRQRTLQAIRTAVRDRKRVATCLQFGPRFLHSTGQLYKGGPNSGVFLQITAKPHADVAIPGRTASFGTIESAQARGDFRILAERGRRLLHVHIGSDVDAGIAAVAEATRLALQ